MYQVKWVDMTDYYEIISADGMECAPEDIVMKINNSVALTELRKAVANYMKSEGCSCCRRSDHDDHAERLAKLLDVPKYDDGSGYDFYKFADE